MAPIFIGFLSYRNENGSFLIQEFCKLLTESGDYLGIADIFDHCIREVRLATKYVLNSIVLNILCLIICFQRKTNSSDNQELGPEIRLRGLQIR